MISVRHFVHGLLRHSKRLIGKAAQPQGADEDDKRADAKTEEVGVGGTKLDRERRAALKMELCLGLVAQKVVSIAHPPLCPDGASRVLVSPRDDAALLRHHQGAADVAKPREKDGLTEEKAQLACMV